MDNLRYALECVAVTVNCWNVLPAIAKVARDGCRSIAGAQALHLVAVQ